MEHRRCVFLELDGVFLIISDFSPRFKHILRAEGCKVKFHLVGIFGVGEGNNRFFISVTVENLVTLIFKECRRVWSSRAVYMQCRLEIVFHAVGKVCFLTFGEVGIFGSIGKPLAEI